jgi:hypothetical protein
MAQQVMAWIETYLEMLQTTIGTGCDEIKKVAAKQIIAFPVLAGLQKQSLAVDLQMIFSVQ